MRYHITPKSFEREVGLFLGAAERLYKRNPELTLTRMDIYFLKAPQPLAGLLANFIQSFRVHHNLPPSEKVNSAFEPECLSLPPLVSKA